LMCNLHANACETVCGLADSFGGPRAVFDIFLTIEPANRPLPGVRVSSFRLPGDCITVWEQLNTMGRN